MRSLILGLALFSSAAFACPNLTGTYATCRSISGNTPGQTDMIVTQSIRNRVTTVEVSAINNETNEREYETYKADGKVNYQEISDPDSGITLGTSSVVSCSKTQLMIKMNMTLNGEAAGYMHIFVSKNGNQLIVDSKSFDGDEVSTEKEICE